MPLLSPARLQSVSRIHESHHRLGLLSLSQTNVSLSSNYFYLLHPTYMCYFTTVLPRSLLYLFSHRRTRRLYSCLFEFAILLENELPFSPVAARRRSPSSVSLAFPFRCSVCSPFPTSPQYLYYSVHKLLVTAS